ncbi:MAG: rod shape-determining protein MreC [Candidatus Eisenbacteria bacterium]|nr:rod shape-determining protein MreC [Candidatus Eisenbacteria bacterium]
MRKSDELPAPSPRYGSLKAAAVCLAFSFLMFVLKPDDARWLSTPRAGLESAVVGLTGTIGWVPRLIVLAEQSRSLHSRVATDPLLLENLEALRQENRRLRNLLGLAQRDEWNAVMAEVVGKETGRLGTIILVNRGSSSGVTEGWIACSPEGLVGKVSRVRETFSQVQLITNYNSPVSVRVERSGVEAVVEWTPALPTKLSMKFVQPDADLKTGDVVVSSGLGGVYPAGLRVGRVTKVRVDQDSRESVIEVRPFVDFSRLAVVLLVAPEKIKVEMLESGLFAPDVD